MKTYQHKKMGDIVKARKITETVTVNLATGEQTFEPGDYEVQADGMVHMVDQEHFEENFEEVTEKADPKSKGAA